MSDQDRISPYNINTISSTQVMRKKKISVKGLGNVQHSPLILSTESLILHTEKRQGKQKEKGAVKENNSL